MRGTLVRGVLVAAVAAVLAVVAGLASAAPAAKKVTLTYFTFSAAPDHLKDLQNIISAFEKRYPNIRINVQTASYNDYWTKLQTQIAGGSAPDSFELNYENFVTYAASKKLLDLGRVARSDRTFRAGAYYPRAYGVFRYGGRQYGLPESFSDVLLFYNKDLFRKAGVAFPKPTWKWADELKAAKKLKQSGVWGDFQPIQFWEFYKVLAQNRGAFFNKSKTRATFDNARGIGALNWLLTKISPAGVMPTQAEMGGLDDTALFKSGRLAMWHNGIWQFAGLKDAPFDWDVVVEPGNRAKANHFFANAVVGSASTKHPREVWTWLRYFTSSPTAVKIRVGNSWELPAVTNKKLLAMYLKQRPPANRGAVFDALKNPVVPPVIAQQQQLTDAVNKWLEKAANGQVSAADALHKAAAEVNTLLVVRR